jgi:transcriptional regulator with XRE-family HTH domain
MNKKIEKELGNNIRKIREMAGMTQDVLSAKLQLNGCDITRSAIAKIEVGQRHLYPDEIKALKPGESKNIHEFEGKQISG